EGSRARDRRGLSRTQPDSGPDRTRKRISGSEKQVGLRLLDHRRMRWQAAAALDRIGARIRLETEVASLRVADRQLVELARALVLQARVLIFDEPSAVLSGIELERVFRVIKELRSHGLGIL